MGGIERRLAPFHCARDELLGRAVSIPVAVRPDRRARRFRAGSLTVFVVAGGDAFHRHCLAVLGSRGSGRKQLAAGLDSLRGPIASVVARRVQAGARGAATTCGGRVHATAAGRRRVAILNFDMRLAV